MFDGGLTVGQPSFVHPIDSYILSLISIIQVKQQFLNEYNNLHQALG